MMSLAIPLSLVLFFKKRVWYERGMHYYFLFAVLLSACSSAKEEYSDRGYVLTQSAEEELEPYNPVFPNSFSEDPSSY